MDKRWKDPLQLAEEANKVINAQAEETQRELNKRAVELSGVDITPKSWIKPNREVLENATKREVKNFLTSVNNSEYEDDPLTKAIKEYMKETTLQTEQMRIDRESKEGGQGL